MEFKDYEVLVTLNVTAPSHEEAVAACQRSGLAPGQLIGEALIYDVDVWDDD